MAVTRTERNMWDAFLSEAKANRFYTAYDLKPLDEGVPEVAQVSVAVARTSYGLGVILAPSTHS